MLKAIITYLNLKLELLNYFEQQHCLSELKSDDEGKVTPVEYVGVGNYNVIDHDAFDGVSYWRLRDKPTQSVLENIYQAGKRLEVSIHLRLVFSVRRTKLTLDDAYAFDRIRQTIVKQFNFDDGMLKTVLGCEKVTVNVPTSNGNAKDVWDDETDNTGTFEPTYEIVYGSIDIDVAVIYKGSCLPTECDDIDSNILHAFDFCKPSIVAQLTTEQVACLEAELCGVCAAATVQLNGTTVGTIASGATDSFDVTQDGSPVGSWDGSEWVIPSCPPCPPSSSLTVSVDDSTPTFGDVIVITPTPTGLTAPITYDYYLPRQDGGFNVVNDGGSTYNYTVDLDGTFCIKVIATDSLGVQETAMVEIVCTYAFLQAQDLNGTTQYNTSSINDSMSIITSTQYIVSFWFMADSLANNPILFSYDAFWFLQIRSTDVRIRTDNTGSGRTYAYTFVIGQWYHVAMQRKSYAVNDVEVSVNGVELTTTAGSVGIDIASAAPMLIGKYAASGGFEFNGKLDDIVINQFFNATGAAIATYYNSGNGHHPYFLGKNPDIWLRMNGNTINSGTHMNAFTAVNSPTYVTH